MTQTSSNDRKVALITGASQGIGWSIAERLARDGMIVIVNGQRSDAAEKAAEALVAAGEEAIALPADVSSEKAVLGLFDEIRSRYGRLDVLVNNAGVALRVDGRKAPVESTPTDMWERTLAVNLTGAFFTSRAAIPLMKERGWGRIINMASQAGRMDTGFGSAYYAASKAGLVGFSRVMAGEVGPHGITVNCVSPGRIKTAMAATFANADAVDQLYIARTPMRKVGMPGDVAGAVSFLASEESAFITGTIIDITGGFFMP